MKAADPEYAAEKETKRIAEAQADSLREVEKVRAAEAEVATKKYARWIEQHGRTQAGELIKEETDAAFTAKDFDRAELLTNASATAMLQDHELMIQRQAEFEAEIQEKINVQFSAWDGSHRALVSAVEKKLNDPGSFEHVETSTMKGSNYPDTFIVRMEYTAKNAFGGCVRKFVIVEVSGGDGKFVKVLNEV